MPPQDLSRGPCPSGQLGAPVTAHRRQLYLAEDDVDDAVEDLLLVLDVVVDGHRLHTELVGQGPNGQGADAAPVGHLHRTTQDLVAVEPWTLGLGVGWYRHGSPSLGSSYYVR